MSSDEFYPTHEDLNTRLSPEELATMRRNLLTGYGEPDSSDSNMSTTPFDDLKQKIENPDDRPSPVPGMSVVTIPNPNGPDAHFWVRATDRTESE